MDKIIRLKNRIRKIIGYYNISKIDPDISVFSSNCTGSFILHDMGIRFNSPFVNLWIEPHDFVKMMSDIKKYMKEPLKFIHCDEISYPVAMCGDVKIYFQHYKTEKEANDKWIRRCRRINYNNIRVIMVERDNCSYDDLIAFDKLPYKKKVVFTHKIYPEIKSSYYICGFEKEKYVGNLYEFESTLSLRKKYDVFDSVKFFSNV